VQDEVDDHLCRHRRATVVAVVLALVAGLFGAAASAVADDGGSGDSTAVAVTQGSLHWGVKTSWRAYAGTPVRADDGGVTVNPDGTFTFPLTSGSYDPSTGTTTALFSGTLQWQGHPAQTSGISPPASYTGSTDTDLMDITLSDPAITIGPDGSNLAVDMVSSSLTTWEYVDYGRVSFATLGTSGITTTVADGQTEWANVPTFLTQDGVDAFAGFLLGRPGHGLSDRRLHRARRRTSSRRAGPLPDNSQSTGTRRPSSGTRRPLPL